MQYSVHLGSVQLWLSLPFNLLQFVATFSTAISARQNCKTTLNSTFF
jgi:hypothetical protein